jgi:hypothetical protein
MWWPWGKKEKFVPVTETDEWITVPYRYAEAARLTIHTIAQQKEIPVEVRQWINLWLDYYNASLWQYMQNNYGPGVFMLLDQITAEVFPNGAPYDDDDDDTDPRVTSPEVNQETWTKWEQQLRGGSSD